MYYFLTSWLISWGAWKWHWQTPMFVRNWDRHKQQRFIEFLKCIRKSSGKGHQLLCHPTPWNSMVERQYSENSINMEIGRYIHICLKMYIPCFPSHTLRDKKKGVRIVVQIHYFFGSASFPSDSLKTFTNKCWVIFIVKPLYAHPNTVILLLPSPSLAA